MSVYVRCSIHQFFLQLMDEPIGILYSMSQILRYLWVISEKQFHSFVFRPFPSTYIRRMANHIYFSCSHDSVLCVWKYEANVGAVSHCLQLRGHDDTSGIKAVDMDETRYAVDFFSQRKIIGNLFPEWKCVKYITCAWYSVRRVGINNYIFFY